MDELEISGRRYISSRRAAKEHHYHADYIGQLIRSGKVGGQKVGRTWYVDAASLATYLELSPEQSDAHSIPRVPLQPEYLPTLAVVEDKNRSASKEQELAPTPESKIETQEEKKSQTPLPPVPHISIAETEPDESRAEGAGLRYLPDSAPLLPEIDFEHRVEIRKLSAEQKMQESVAVPFEDGKLALISSPSGKHNRRGGLRYGLLGISSLLAFAIALGASSTLTSHIEVEGTVQTASITFSAI